MEMTAERIYGGNIATLHKILLAQTIAKRDFNSGHLKNPYTHCKVLSNAYNSAALRLLKKEKT